MRDESMVSGLLEGDPEVIAQVRAWIRGAFTPYRSKLSSELEDLEQEILLELSQALRTDRFRGQSSLSTYTKTYVHHKCIDRLRALGRRQWVQVEDLDLRSREPSALEGMQKVELATRILQDMPESCRELWQMLEQGMRYREMSERLGVSEGTLRARVLRCRKGAVELRAKLFSEKSAKKIEDA